MYSEFRLSSYSLNIMKSDKMCFIVEFDEFTRQACVESLPEESFSQTTVTDEKGIKKTYLAWATTVKFARSIRENGIQQGKQMNFRVVVARENGTFRFAKAGEWILSVKSKASIARSIAHHILQTQAKKLVRGRIGTVQK